MSRSGSDGVCLRGGRRAGRSLLVVLCISAAGLLLWSASALALSQRGHVFSPSASFGTSGSGEGQLSSPSAVAVSEVGEAAGDVYVADRGNNRVEQFDPTGKFIAAWGWGVKDGEKETEVCKSGEGCKPGLPGAGKGSEGFHLGKGQIVSPIAIAVDNSKSASAGDVYVVVSVVPEKSYVDKFGPNGEYLRQLTKKEETEFNGRVEGVAVDANGVVWVDWSESEITNFTGGEPNKRVNKEVELESAITNLRPGFAVDASGHVYVNTEPAEIFTQGEEGTTAEEGKGEGGEEPCEAAPCYASKLIMTGEEPGGVQKLRMNQQNTSGMAADLGNNDVYVDNLTSVATYGPNGALIERLGAGDLTHGAGLAVQAGDGNLYVADAATGKIDVFVPEPAGAPDVDEVSVGTITTTAAELGTEVDAKGAETTVTFQYGTSSCTGGSCVSVPASEPTIPTSFGDRARSVSLEGLATGTTYHYRVVAKNSFGTVTSPESMFTTQSGASFALLDGRGWELVSPASKNGAGFEAITKEGGVIQASAEGDGLTFVGTGPDEVETEGNRSPELTQLLAKRATNGEGKAEWSSKDINTPNDTAVGIEGGKAPEYQYFSSDLSSAIVRPKTPEPLLSEEASEVTPYIRENNSCGPVPSPCYRPLVTGKEGFSNVPSGTKFGGTTSLGVQLIDAEPDLKHVVLDSEAVPLTSEPAASGPNLYEWSEGTLKLINVLPENGGPAFQPDIGSLSNNMRHALADNGARVFWTASGSTNAENAQQLYLRDMGKEETVRLDVAQGVAQPIKEGATFEAASADGSKVFFKDVQPLVPGATTAQGASPDLYECEIGEQAGKLVCTLRDLTEGTSPGEEAAMQGTILGESEDASTIYFVANGVLGSAENSRGEKATPGECVPNEPGAEATCNLYEEHYDATGHKWEEPQFIATLASLDEPDWGTHSGLGSLFALTSRVSPNGRYLSFMSDRSLTGYDNRDVNSGALDEEVFLYDANSGQLVCASCDPTGGRPAGVFDKPGSGPEGLGLLADRPELWAERWLAGNIPGWTALSGERALYQSRYLSDSGRLFFNSADQLVPADKNGKNDVYEYEPAGLGSCASEGGCVGLVSSGKSEKESAFLDASVSGNDVFFITAGSLVTQDQDTNFDIYDARVCAPEGCVSSSEESTATCQEVATCRPAAPTLPVFTAPGTVAPSGSSNLVPTPAVKPPGKPVVKPTRAQLLAKALKACRKNKSKHKRVACERLARKKYAAKKASHKASKSSRRRGR
jgi:hypothetical protein